MNRSGVYERRKRKAPSEMRKHQMPMVGLRFDPIAKDLLQRHAFERHGVRLGPMCEDIILMWLHAVTDLSDPVFNAAVLNLGGMPDLPPERWPGYRESLNFIIEERPSPPGERDHTSGAPEGPGDEAFVQAIAGRGKGA